MTTSATGRTSAGILPAVPVATCNPPEFCRTLRGRLEAGGTAAWKAALQRR